MVFLEACTSQKYISNFVLNENKITVRKSEFIAINKKKPTELSFVLIKPEQFPFPIALYKDGDTAYTALFMQCTHQGCELNPHERMIVCPCHGAEFNTKGEVTQGPAEIKLKSFITRHDNENIYIQLT
jgi:cytochrome b6-f complex iron-sulfur subunit